MAINNEEKINSIASQILGPRPDPNAGAMQAAEGTPAGAESQAPAPEMAGGMAPQEEAPASPKEDSKPTTEEKAQESASPKTEGDQVSAQGVIYEVDFGKDGKRKLNDTQIKSTFDRYGKLNAEHATVKPAMELVKNLMKEKGMDAKAMADYIQNATKAFESNPVMGNIEESKSPGEPKMAISGNQTPEEVEKMFATYEEENSIQLPPGYREQMGETAKMREMITKQNDMIQKLVDASSGMAQASAEQVQETENAAGENMKAQIGMNLNQAQQANNLSDADANDFMMYAAERGYTMEDFVDPDLTMKVVQDFANTKNTPEMERLKQVAARRSAITGSVGSTPSSAPPMDPAQADPNTDILSRLAQRRVM